MDKFEQVSTFCRYTQVSRETITSLKKYENLIIKHNRTLNLIGKSTISQIWVRHFLDSSQVIDFIDKNEKTLVDLGTGAGFPGMVIALLAKDRKIPLKILLIEKSPKKISFLRAVVNNLMLDVEIMNTNVLEQSDKLRSDIIVARAFKPLKNILHFLNQKAVNWKKIFLFLGKNGRNELLQASKSWDIEYKQRMSISSSDSIIIEVSRLKKK